MWHTREGKFQVMAQKEKAFFSSGTEGSNIFSEARKEFAL
jgi:hypothetical protein